MDKCAASLHFAIQVFWFLQAAVEDAVRDGDKEAEGRCRLLRTRCETAAVNGNQTPILAALRDTLDDGEGEVFHHAAGADVNAGPDGNANSHFNMSADVEMTADADAAVVVGAFADFGDCNDDTHQKSMDIAGAGKPPSLSGDRRRAKDSLQPERPARSADLPSSVLRMPGQSASISSLSPVRTGFETSASTLAIVMQASDSSASLDDVAKAGSAMTMTGPDGDLGKVGEAGVLEKDLETMGDR